MKKIPDTETMLIRTAQHGDAHAFNMLVLKYQDMLYRIAWRILHEESAADDATQNAMIQAFKNIRSFRGGSFKSWLARVTVNASYDELRRWKRQPSISQEQVNGGESAARKGLTIGFHPDPAFSTILADKRHLKQILINLISNAVKFTPSSGKVTLTVQANRARDAIDLSVCDSGIGISASDLRRLFQPFTQVDSSLTRQHEGTGLGLALVKRLTDLHGGGISVTSEVGQGSCFTVSLPWQQKDADVPFTLLRADPDRADPASSRDQIPMHGTVLLAEDTETNILVRMRAMTRASSGSGCGSPLTR